MVKCQGATGEKETRRGRTFSSFIVDRLLGQTARQMQHAADRFREDGPNQMYNALFEGDEMSSKDVVPDEDREQDSGKEPDNDEHLEPDRERCSMVKY